MATDNNSDEEIVGLVISGDTTAYEELVKRYQNKLLRYVIYLVRDQATAEDVVQDSFIKAYVNLKGFNPKYKFSSWLYRIAHNGAINTIKKDGQTLVHSKLVDLKYVFIDDKGAAIDQQILKKDVQGCLQLLNPKYKEVLILHYFERMRYAEIGSVLQIPTSTVGVRLKRAKSALRRVCQTRGVNYD